MPRPSSSKPLVAPISTVLFIPNTGPSAHDPNESNIPAGKHFTDMPAPGTIALLQQPPGLLCAVLGDIMATRFYTRGVYGVVANGRIRDIGPIGHICATQIVQAEDDSKMPFTVWSKGTSTVGPALECRAWCADVPLTIGRMEVKPGDYLFADETKRGAVVIPQEKDEQVVHLLPEFKEKDDRPVADVQAGMSIVEVIKRHP